jgi:hypothetical protein
MDRETLKKKTVAELKEMAKEVPDAKGLSAMKKDDLVELLAGADKGSKPPVAKPPVAKPAAAKPPTGGTGGPLDKAELNRRIHALKEEKREAVSQRDHARSHECNRKIHAYKRRLRKLAKGKGKK